MRLSLSIWYLFVTTTFRLGHGGFLPVTRSLVRQRAPTCPLDATVAEDSADTSTTNSPLTKELIHNISSSTKEAKEWSEMFGLGESEAAFYALFKGIRNVVPLGLKGQPFVLHEADVLKATNIDENVFKGWFDRKELEKAVNDDFLDADRGSTDANRGWQVASVSEPRGNSFEDAKMLFSEVEYALERGTVIFNSAGAHIPRLAGANLATTDATSLPCAINIYVTAPGKKTSAPPHTDKQDVVVVQTTGRKHWKVYSPPDPSLKPMADMVRISKTFMLLAVSWCTIRLSDTIYFSLLAVNTWIIFHFMPLNRILDANSCWKQHWNLAMCYLYPLPFHTPRQQLQVQVTLQKIQVFI